MKELLLVSPTLNTFDSILTALYLLIALVLFANYRRKADILNSSSRNFMFPLVGTILTAVVLMFKIVLHNESDHQLDSIPTPVMLMLVFQFFMPATLYSYYKIRHNTVRRHAYIAIAALSLINLTIIGIYYRAPEPVIHGVVSLLALIYSSLLIILVRKVMKETDSKEALPFPLNSARVMFFISAAFTVITVLLFICRVCNLFFYIIFASYLVFSLSQVLSLFFIPYKSDYLVYESGSPELYSDLPAVESSFCDGGEKYTGDSGRISDIRMRLINYLEKEKPYLRHKLTIADVSADLYTNKTYVSRAINEFSNINFNQLINQYRINEAKRIFYENPDISMEELCSQSGFGSMAAFSVAFRLYANATPSDWCKSQKIKLRNEAKERN